MFTTSPSALCQFLEGKHNLARTSSAILLSNQPVTQDEWIPDAASTTHVKKGSELSACAVCPTKQSACQSTKTTSENLPVNKVFRAKCPAALPLLVIKALPLAIVKVLKLIQPATLFVIHDLIRNSCLVLQELMPRI